MSGAKENPCRKFQANIFNKSKCQNCFKPRELHLLTDQDLNQAKPIYGGWLCLAPEGTDFDNPMQRSRKWQRRFFVLYEHGCLRFALDESPSTLPQGTVNMNQCTDVIDAEPRTGQKNALCIITPEQEYFIRGENKEIIHGWSEQLVVYPRTNKQNQKKKRKVEPTTSQEPGPAKVAVTGSGIPEAEKVPDSRSIIWQEELHSREADVAQVWPSADIPALGSPPPPTGEAGSADLNSDQGSVNGDEADRGGLPFRAPLDLLSPTGSASSRHSGELGGVPRCHSPAPSDPFPSGSSLLSNGSHVSGSMSSLDSDASGEPPARSHRPAGPHEPPRSRRHEAEARKAEKRSRARSPERGRSTVIEKLEALELENAERMEVEEAGRSGGRQGRSETRRFQREERDPARGLDFHHSTLPPLRRAKSLDRRTTESVMTPDLLNFKKGWMVKVDEQGQWKKYWFVLTDHSLRYYKDSIAEEASDLDGEIDLTTCYNVTEYQVQRNYGFQIHTQEAVYTLSAMTAGIRRNWIQAVMKNVRPSTAPDVASLTDDHGPCETLLKPDVTQDSPSSEASSVEREPGPKKSRARERRREGRSKTFDWAEFRPIAQALAQQRAQEADVLQAEFGDPERNKRREERRKRYESVTGPPPEAAVDGGNGKMDVEGGDAGEPRPRPPSPERQQRVQDEIEQHWQQVEQTPIREERRVPLSSPLQGRETSELEKLLESYKKGVEELKEQLESCHHQLVDSNHHKLELEDQLRTALEREQHIRIGYISPLESPLGLETDLESQKTRHELVSSQAQNLKKKYQETKELLQQQELKKRSMQAQLGLSLLPLSIKEPCLTKVQTSDVLETQPPEPVCTKKFSILLQDSEDKLQELEKVISGSPLTIRDLVRLLSSSSQITQEDRLRFAEGHEQGSFGNRTCCQKVFESLKHQQELEIESLRRSLTRASDSVRDYEVRLLSMEGMLGRAQSQKMESLKGHYGPQYQIEEYTDTNEVRRLSQEVELLTNENEVLNQHYQEILNQLTEADREIERLKAELFNQRGGQQHLLVVEELKQVKTKLAERDADSIDREFYEKELNKKSQKLQEALIRMEVLGSSLKDTEKKLHLKEATLKGLGFQVAKDNDHDLFLEEKEELQHRLNAAEARLCKQEKQICSAEKSFMELQAQNTDLKLNSQQSENIHRQRLAEAQSKIKMLQENVEGLRKSDGEEGEVYRCEEETHGSEHPVSVDRGVQQVVKEIKRKSEALRKVCEVIAKVDINVKPMFKEWMSAVHGSVSSLVQSEVEGVEVNQEMRSKLIVEGEFWGRLLSAVEDSSTESNESEIVDSSVRDVIEHKVVEKKMLLLASSLFPQANMGVQMCNKDIENVDGMKRTSKACGNLKSTEYIEGEISTEVKKEKGVLPVSNWLDNDNNPLIWNDLLGTLERKMSLLTQTASIMQASSDEELQSLVLKLCHSRNQRKGWVAYVEEASMEANSSYLMSRLDIRHQNEVEELRLRLQAFETGCKNCAKLKRQNEELMVKLEPRQRMGAGLQTQMPGEHKPITHIQIEGEPIDSLDKAIQLQDMVAKYKKELREVKDAYELEAEKLRREAARAGETLRLQSEENVKEIDSLTICMENMKRKHELERSVLKERFERKAEELRRATPPERAETPGVNETRSASSLQERIRELESQVSVMTEEMKQRGSEGDTASLRLKYEKDLVNLKVEVFLVSTLSMLPCNFLVVTPPPTPIDPTPLSSSASVINILKCCMCLTLYA